MSRPPIDDIQELRVAPEGVSGIYMGQRFTLFHSPFLSVDETSAKEDNACFIRDAWPRQQLNLEPLRQHPGWTALCELTCELARRWVAQHLANEYPGLSLSPNLLLVLSTSHRVVRNHENREITLRAYHSAGGRR